MNFYSFKYYLFLADNIFSNKNELTSSFFVIECISFDNKLQDLCLAQSHSFISNAMGESTKLEKQQNESLEKVLFNVIKHLNQTSSQTLRQEQSLIITYKPTVGLNVLKYRNNKDRLMIWDLGGKQNIRKIWQNYYPQCHGVIYLINHNIEEGIQTLKSILGHQQMAKIPISIIITQQSVRQKVEQLLNNLQFLRDRKYNFYCIPIDKMAYMKVTIQEILHKIYLLIQELHYQIKQ